MQNKSYVDIQWRLHLQSSPEKVYSYLNTDEGRSNFWATSAIEIDGSINFQFPNNFQWKGKILQRENPNLLSIEYINRSITTFYLESDDKGGTDLRVVDHKVLKKWQTEVTSGWVSVLMALKAAVDFNVDLRNHDINRTWDQGYCNN